MDLMQFEVLPLGSVLTLCTIVWIAAKVRLPNGATDAAWSILVGLAGGLLLMALLLYLRRLPYAFPCLNCGFQDRPWYSCVLTFTQGFGFSAGAVLIARMLRRRRTLSR